MRSASNIEMWPCLLEKAYAKAKGSYELLNHWLPIDGCIELTGWYTTITELFTDLRGWG
jgi:hypothetical protein